MNDGKCRLVIVTWVDSRQAEGAWRWLSEYARQTPVTVQTVGWLIQDDDDAKVLVQSLGADGDDVQYAGRKVIAAAAVLRIEPLAEVDESAAQSTEVAA